MRLGPLGRLGHWTATHFRTVAATWVLIAIAFGVFAPRAEHALSGAGLGGDRLGVRQGPRTSSSSTSPDSAATG